MLEKLEEIFRQVKPSVKFCSLRYVHTRDEVLSVRQDVVEPVHAVEDTGAMITIINNGGLGYAATSDLSPDGLRQAVLRAEYWADKSAGRCVIDYGSVPMPEERDEYRGPEEIPYDSVPLADKIDLLRNSCKLLKIDDRIVDWQAAVQRTLKEQLYLTCGGGRVHQRFSFIVPVLKAVANEKAETQHRTLKGRAFGRQGGMEVFDNPIWKDGAPRIAEEALELLSAPNCPTETMDVVLAPDQLILQLHESIGHPLELDRILGDERNYAGTSFVTPDMFGSYQYGSPLLNVSADPTLPTEFASFGYDDEGLKAEKLMLIEKGILKRGLGGITSQTRSGIPGVANARASGWNRPPIDRMPNLNIEPGDSTFDEVIDSVERGVYMETNKSWSIDDSRNKFQFGCEWARLIENGKLGGVVKNPNYRGISATFWRSLKDVGNADTFEIFGTPNCGKGEPNQIARVGHAIPVCAFGDVEVFGGE